MWFASNQEVSVFRPAPFAVYCEDSERKRLERTRKLLSSLVLTLALLPAAAGPANEPVFPVEYARVELPTRVPCMISLGLAAADLLVQPASLGHFSSTGDFIYSGQVPRGLVYGRLEGTAVVLEIAAPLDLDAYIEQQLNDIRQHVSTLNRQQNLLRLAREDRPLKDGPLAEDVDQLWRELGPDLGTVLAPEQLAAIATPYGKGIGEFTQALLIKARHHARLKRLFYEGQEARLSLMLSQLNLQLGLSQMPHEEFDSLPSLGNASVVRETMLGEIDRLRQAWRSRQQELERRATADRELLEDAARFAPSFPLDTLGAALEPSPYRPQQPEMADLAALEPDIQLRLGIATARLVVTSAELQMLVKGLERLDDATEQTHLAGWTDSEELLRRKPQFALTRLSGLEQLDAYATVAEASHSVESAIDLLHRLATSFEDGTAGGNSQWYPEEVAYGVLAVDAYLTGATQLPAGQQPDDIGPYLVRELDKALAFPADDETNVSSLGYLQFVRWYADLTLQAQQAETQPKLGDKGVHEPEIEIGSGDSSKPADVDRLFN